MLGGRADHLGAQEPAAGVLGIDPQHARVDGHHPAAALVLERDLADRKAGARAQQRGMALPGHGDLRVTKHHRQRGAAGVYPNIWKPPGVVASNAAFIGRLVQQGQGAGGVARHEDRADTDLAGAGIKHRHPVRVKRQTGPVQAQLRNIGAAAGGGQQPVEVIGFGRVGVAAHADLVALPRQHQHARPSRSVERRWLPKPFKPSRRARPR